MKARKEYLVALGFLTLLVFVGVATSPILKNEKWWSGWWVCEYADGTLVYHWIRLERTYEESVMHFNGEWKPGDCDSFMVIDGIEHYVCYDSAGAAEMKRLHGPIKSVRKEAPPPHRPPPTAGKK